MFESWYIRRLRLLFTNGTIDKPVSELISRSLALITCFPNASRWSFCDWASTANQLVCETTLFHWAFSSYSYGKVASSSINRDLNSTRDTGNTIGSIDWVYSSGSILLENSSRSWVLDSLPKLYGRPSTKFQTLHMLVSVKLLGRILLQFAASLHCQTCKSSKQYICSALKGLWLLHVTFLCVALTI